LSAEARDDFPAGIANADGGIFGVIFPDQAGSKAAHLGCLGLQASCLYLNQESAAKYILRVSARSAFVSRQPSSVMTMDMVCKSNNGVTFLMRREGQIGAILEV
jgi:hypothetical protein